MTPTMIDLIQFVQFELFLVALDCFFWGGVMGYDHLIFRREREEALRCGE